jgi:hypothetical protein
MFTTYIVVTILRRGQYFLGHARFHPLQANPHQHGESRRVGIVDNHTGNLKSSRRARIADRIACLRLESPPPPASSCFLSALSSLTCAGTTTRSASRSCSFSWQSPRCGCDWFRAEESDLIQLSIEFRRSNGSNFGPAQFMNTAQPTCRLSRPLSWRARRLKEVAALIEQAASRTR